MSRFVAPSTPCPSCAGATAVDTGEHIKEGYRRRRHCKTCGCKFISLLEKGATEEKILLVQVVGNVPTAEPKPDDDDESEPIEPEPGADWGSPDQLRRAFILSLYSDKLVLGRGEYDRETLELRAALQQRKLRMAA